MTTTTRSHLEAVIDELHREAARQIALSTQPEYVRTVAGSRICKERAQECLQAAAHLMEEL